MDEFQFGREFENLKRRVDLVEESLKQNRIIDTHAKGSCTYEVTKKVGDDNVVFKVVAESRHWRDEDPWHHGNPHTELRPGAYVETRYEKTGNFFYWNYIETCWEFAANFPFGAINDKHVEAGPPHVCRCPFAEAQQDGNQDISGWARFKTEGGIVFPFENIITL